MNTRALHTRPSHPDAWHQVCSPGGYEWWYFDAEDKEHDRQLVAILFQGFVFHPGYLRRYFRYRRWPTRFAPPVPSEYPCAYFALYESGKLRRQFMTQYSADAFDAATIQPGVSVGPNRITPDGSRLELQLEGTPWQLTWRGPRLRSERLHARLSFSPRLPHAPVERAFLSRELSHADHHWIIANPLCDVAGMIQLGDEQFEFGGRGYHDHNWGTAPLGPGLRSWFWGRILLEDAALTFHYARPRDPALPAEVHLIQASGEGIAEVATRQVSADWSARSLFLHYPRRIDLDDVLRLARPHVIDSSPFYMRLKYEATCRNRTGMALCEIAYPHRLRWPVLGRMIEMSIDHKRPLG
jgi:carotenoid 1,2-hydratase